MVSSRFLGCESTQSTYFRYACGQVQNSCNVRYLLTCFHAFDRQPPESGTLSLNRTLKHLNTVYKGLSLSNKSMLQHPIRFYSVPFVLKIQSSIRLYFLTILNLTSVLSVWYKTLFFLCLEKATKMRGFRSF